MNPDSFQFGFLFLVFYLVVSSVAIIIGRRLALRVGPNLEDERTDVDLELRFGIGSEEDRFPLTHEKEGLVEGFKEAIQGLDADLQRVHEKTREIGEALGLTDVPPPQGASRREARPSRRSAGARKSRP